MRDSQAWKFYRHMPVYLANGRLLGHALEVDHGVEYVHVQQGRVLVRDWYIPLSAMESVSESGIVLSLHASDLRSQGLQIPPQRYLQHQGSTPGYEYTSRADLPHHRAE